MSKLDTITIKCRHQFSGKTVESKVPVLAAVGAFVLIEYPQGTFSVTHRPTGWRATASADCATAKKAMHDLAEVPGIDWEAMTPESAKEIQGEARKRVAQIKAFAEADLF